MRQYILAHTEKTHVKTNPTETSHTHKYIYSMFAIGGSELFELSTTWLAQNIEKTSDFWLRGHLARENSVRGHFEVAWLKKTRLEVTSRSLRGNLARENSAQSHLEVEKT
jgi:hypothetical protein